MTGQGGPNNLATTIDVVIVSYNSAELLPRCLDAIADQQADGVGVIVVDNASADDSVAVAQAHPIGAHAIESGGNFGYSAAINIGIDHSEAEAILILNPDTALHPGSIDALRTALEETDAGIVAPKIIDPDGTVAQSIHRFPSALRQLGQMVLGYQLAGRSPALGDLVVDDGAYNERGRHDWCSGAVLLVSRACLEDVGRWDESYFLYSEETDYAWRAVKHGYTTLFEPSAVVEHVGGDSGTSPRLRAILATNQVLVVEKHRGKAHALAFRLASIVGEVLRSRRPQNRAALVALVTGRLDPAVIAAQQRQASYASTNP